MGMLYPSAGPDPSRYDTGWRSPPNVSGGLLAHVLAYDAQCAQMNRVLGLNLGQNDAQIIGSPVYHNGYIEFAGNPTGNYLQTNVLEPASFLGGQIARFPDFTGVGLNALTTGSSPFGLSVGATSSVNIAMRLSYWKTSFLATIAAGVMTVTQMVAGSTGTIAAGPLNSNAAGFPAGVTVVSQLSQSNGDGVGLRGTYQLSGVTDFTTTQPFGAGAPGSSTVDNKVVTLPSQSGHDVNFQNMLFGATEGVGAFLWNATSAQAAVLLADARARCPSGRLLKFAAEYNNNTGPTHGALLILNGGSAPALGASTNVDARVTNMKTDHAAFALRPGLGVTI